MQDAQVEGRGGAEEGSALAALASSPFSATSNVEQSGTNKARVGGRVFLLFLNLLAFLSTSEIVVS